MTHPRALLTATLALALALALPVGSLMAGGAAAAAPAGTTPATAGHTTGPATAPAARSLPDIEVGRVTLTGPSGRGRALLVPLRYPRELAGRDTQVTVRLVGGGPTRIVRVPVRPDPGRRRTPDRRDLVAATVAVPLPGPLAERVARGRVDRVTVTADTVLDLESDGVAEALAEGTRRQRSVPRAAAGACSTPSLVRAVAGTSVTEPLPYCGGPVRWTVAADPRAADARIDGDRLVVTADPGVRGPVVVRLAPAARTRSAAGAPAGSVPVQVRVGATSSGPRVRAIGDSVTAGFGYYANGDPMAFSELSGCKPQAKENDACSSNSTNTNSSKGTVVYSPDYGLGNNISWAAQWANAHGITDYKNYAVTGSEPADWLPGGQLFATTQAVEAEQPDIILMTMGANPILSNVLFGLDNMKCALYSDLYGNYEQCVQNAFAAVDLEKRLTALYTHLLANTSARIVVMQYHLAIPASALAYTSQQLAVMGQLMNKTIATVAAAVDPARISVVAPPVFTVGIDMAPVYPNPWTCSYWGYKVDGRSVQSSATQTELLILHPLSFCSGPPSGGPWVISADTGIHPSAAGYTQMARQVPPP